MEKLNKKFHKIYEFIMYLTGDNVSTYAAQASFFLIISAIPLLMLIFTIAKLFIDVDQIAILHTINSFMPSQVSGLISTILNELLDKSSSISVISITAVSTLWLASSGISGLYRGLEKVYNLPTRNFFYVRFVSIIYTLAFVATLILTMLFFFFGSKVESFFAVHFAFMLNIIQLFLRRKILFFTIYLTMLFALFYKFMPRRKNKFVHQIPGALISAIGWEMFSFIYSIYIDNFSNYSYVYGSLTALVLLMLWIYFCMNIFLYGAQINKMIKNGFFKK